MSIKLMTKVFDTDIDWGEGSPSAPTIKLVLLALADHASETGEAVYPSITHICSKTGLSRHAVTDTLAAARKRGVLAAIGKRRQVIEYRLNFDVLTGTSPLGGRVPVPQGDATSPPQVHVIINEPSKEPPCADARALTPSGSGNEVTSPRRRRDPFEIEADFEARRTQGRAEGRDRAAAAHPLASTPHLVPLCQSFERLAGFFLADLPKSRTGIWRKDLEDMYGAGVTADDMARLYAYARKNHWKVLRPGSLTNAVGEIKRQVPAGSEPTYAKPSF